MQNTSKYAPIFQRIQPNQKNSPKTDVKIINTSNGLTNSPSFCVSSQTSKLAASNPHKPVHLDAEVTSIPCETEAVAVSLENEITPPKLPDMPILMQILDEVLQGQSFNTPKPDNSRPANKIPRKMVSIYSINQMLYLKKQSLHFHLFRFQPLQPLNISKVAVKNSIEENHVRPDATNDPTKRLSQQKNFIRHDHTYQTIPNQTKVAENQSATDPNTSSQQNVAISSLTSSEASPGISEEPIAEKSDGDSGYVSAMPHCSTAQDMPKLNIKSEYDSDSDVEYVSHYKLGTSHPPTPPPLPSEFHDLTIDSGTDDEWEVFMTVYKAGDLDIKPIVKLEQIEPN